MGPTQQVPRAQSTIVQYIDLDAECNQTDRQCSQGQSNHKLSKYNISPQLYAYQMSNS